ncbi:5-guanidino-2-oxopentanoate decarboxylase [Mesorhizobium sp. BAC0120]|uniref:5-guanidino-2-oxopentanoate decarboxylase n=1 Tax=Mesorhizobium sp. BAC0120 TaxID=3090670 RepID=UPI00298D0E4F|nr:5-guanidino-2-oxopentanoate decarboxylase [Mesorhizobium sp. BAC0120]MDW6024729.1 5-guanidino-2-oxopentanoate decarboxylase [Mesorhizobium sp. BAC0120]
METFGTYLVKLLRAYDVDTVFGIPGVHTIELYRGLPGSGIRHVTPRHEQGAGFMADGYARASGKPGVCFIITGPGLTNVATAVAQAYADSVPMLVISGVNALGDMGSGEGFLHELPDQRQLMKQITAFSHTILKIEELEWVMARAFAVFSAARPRPVHIEIPIDLMAKDASGLPAPRRAPPPLKPAPHAAAVRQIAGLAGECSSPLIIAGGGAAEAAIPLRALAEALDAPVMMTVNGRGLLPAGHPLAVPCTPSLSGCAELVACSDLVIAVGTELGPTDFDPYGTGRPTINGRLVRIDIDAEQAMRGNRADMTLISDSAVALSALSEAVAPAGSRNGAQRAAQARDTVRRGLDRMMAAGLRLLESVLEALPDAIIVGDSTQPAYAGCLSYAAPRPRLWFCSSTGYGTLGYALPAAIGAAIGVPDRPVICVIGDGGIQFTLAELGSAVDAETPLVVLLWNNCGYGEIKTHMRAQGVEPLGVDIQTPDFKLIAHAYDWEYLRLDPAQPLALLLRNATQARQRIVIEVNESEFLAASG